MSSGAGRQYYKDVNSFHTYLSGLVLSRGSGKNCLYHFCLNLTNPRFSHKDRILLKREKIGLGSILSKLPEDIDLDIKIIIMRILSLAEITLTSWVEH